MSAQLLGIISSVLLMVIGVWKMFSRKAAERRKQAEQARKDLDEANKNDDPGKFLDGFGRL
jgi:ABC-type nickel/cobalt efflux system permease component RcnA